MVATMLDKRWGHLSRDSVKLAQGLAVFAVFAVRFCRSRGGLSWPLGLLLWQPGLRNGSAGSTPDLRSGSAGSTQHLLLLSHLLGRMQIGHRLIHAVRMLPLLSPRVQRRWG